MTRVAAAAGFTLLEVLAALAVMAIALAALWQTLGQSIAVTSALPDRVTATWVAHNRIVRRQAVRQWPDVGAQEGSEEMAGQTWYWRESVSAAGEPQLRRLTVAVGKAPDELSLAALEGFIRRPADLPDEQ